MVLSRKEVWATWGCIEGMYDPRSYLLLQSVSIWPMAGSWKCVRSVLEVFILLLRFVDDTGNILHNLEVIFRMIRLNTLIYYYS